MIQLGELFHLIFNITFASVCILGNVYILVRLLNILRLEIRKFLGKIKQDEVNNEQLL
jgi:hypothetical protein